MSLLMVEGFDNVATADLTGKGWLVSGDWPVSSSYARNGVGQGVRNNSIGNSLVQAFTGAGTVILGFAFRVVTGYSGYDVLQLRNDTTAHVSFGYNGTLKRLDAWTGSFGTLAGSTPTNSVLLDRWYHIEIKVYVHDSSGTIEMRVNEVATALTGLDTKNGSTTTIDNVRFGGPAANALAYFYLDDMYVLDTGGSAPLNDFIGDVVVQTLRPNGNGAASSLTGSDGNSTDNYLLVDDTTPDEETTYVQSSTAGHQDLYTFSNLNANTYSVYGLQVCGTAKKDDSGTRSLKLLTRSDGVTYADSGSALSSGSYSTYKHIRETDPDTSAQWTIAAVDAAEFGVEVV